MFEHVLVYAGKTVKYQERDAWSLMVDKMRTHIKRPDLNREGYVKIIKDLILKHAALISRYSYVKEDWITIQSTRLANSLVDRAMSEAVNLGEIVCTPSTLDEGIHFRHTLVNLYMKILRNANWRNDVPCLLREIAKTRVDKTENPRSYRSVLAINSFDIVSYLSPLVMRHLASDSYYSTDDKIVLKARAVMFSEMMVLTLIEVYSQRSAVENMANPTRKEFEIGLERLQN